MERIRYLRSFHCGWRIITDLYVADSLRSRRMANLTISDEGAQRLEEIARREHRSVEEVLNSLLEMYGESKGNQCADARAAMDGMFDDDVPDLSATARETMAEYYRKNGSSG